MTIDDFDDMDEMERYEAIRDSAVLVAERVDSTYKYKLYQIDSFYVENRFHIEYGVTNQQIAFTAEDDEYINPYLDQLNL
jgi:sulfur relay (sulfurtransferase) DsrF/TusC family protein